MSGLLLEMKSLRLMVAVLIVFSLTACGQDGKDGADGLQALVNTTTLDGTAQCPIVGGVQIDSGLDLNSDGNLDADEIQQTQYICHGQDGADGDSQTPLNDTGITLCGDYAYNNSGANQNNLDCAAVGATQTTAGIDANNDPVPAGQDAVYGRDALATKGQLSKVGYGPAGFDYTKLDANGDDLPEEATDWNCVRDNVTGLIWEVKTTSGLHSASNTYTWYSTTNHGGNVGTQNGGSCFDSACDTKAFTEAVNNEELCGFSDWRMPSTSELSQLVHRGRYNPAISTELFPNTQSSHYWSSSPVASDSSYGAWLVYFGDGVMGSYGYKGNSFSVRLVRGGQ